MINQQAEESCNKLVSDCVNRLQGELTPAQPSTQSACPSPQPSPWVPPAASRGLGRMVNGGGEGMGGYQSAPNLSTHRDSLETLSEGCV